jgi:hypothetical protein
LHIQCKADIITTERLLEREHEAETVEDKPRLPELSIDDKPANFRKHIEENRCSLRPGIESQKYQVGGEDESACHNMERSGASSGVQVHRLL